MKCFLVAGRQLQCFFTAYTGAAEAASSRSCVFAEVVESLCVSQLAEGNFSPKWHIHSVCAMLVLHVAICASLRRGTKFAGCLMTGRAGGAAGTARRCGGAGRLEWPMHCYACHRTEAA